MESRDPREPEPREIDGTWGRFSLLVKLNLTIGFAFLLTMSAFLILVQREQRRFMVEHSVPLVRATLRDLASRMSGGSWPDSAEFVRIEEILGFPGPHRHVLLAVDASGRIVGAGSSLAGRKLRDVFAELPSEPDWNRGTFLSDGKSDWLGVGIKLATGETLVLLMDWEHVASNLRRERLIHVVYFIATLALFSLLLWIVTERFVRRPLRALSTAIRSVGSGPWRTDSALASRDEFGWLQSRFEAMAARLHEHVTRLVRSEKYASAAIVVLRVERETRAPLAAMGERIRRLARLAQTDHEVAALAAALDWDWRMIDRSMRKLADVQPPGDWDV